MSERERCSEHPLMKWPRHCAVCKKEFYANDDWAYQIRKGPKGRKFFCSWGCLRKYEKEQEKKA